jgi:hypothetical protein
MGSTEAQGAAPEKERREQRRVELVEETYSLSLRHTEPPNPNHREPRATLATEVE